jgi:hypothetical protein
MYLPTLRALYSLNARDAAAAIPSLETASRYDLAVGGVGFNGFFGALYPVYVRGEAYLEAHRPAEAAAELQRNLDHRSIALVDPNRRHGAPFAGTSARALGRHREGDAYKDLLALWKNADAEIPRIEEARAEYARLR